MKKSLRLLAGAAVIAGLAGLAPSALAVGPARQGHGLGFAETQLSNRLDSGNGGNWATDTITRFLVITKTGVNTYKATVTDEGSFVTIPGALTPNQSSPYTGMRLTASRVYRATDSLAGTDSFSFTANRSPDLSRVPKKVPGNADPTSTWYTLAFPSGTAFTNVTQGPWGWTYQLSCPSFNPNFHPLQIWTDSSTVANNDGDAAADGNVHGC